MALTEKNIFIAEFMGYDKSRIVEELPIDKDGNYTTDGNKWIWVNELQYNYNWDHLMKVVEKIETLGFDVYIAGISCYICRLCENDRIVGLVCGDRTKKHYLVYDTVVNFILWYNKQKQQ